MTIIKNSLNLNTVNEKALTFEIGKEGGSEYNQALEVREGDTITNTIDAKGLESEISAMEKLAAAFLAIAALKCELLDAITEANYSVVCHADDFAEPFTAFTGVSTTIPYHVVRYEPTDGSFLDGEFTAGRSGYYDVSAFFENDLLVAPANVNLWLLIGGSFDSCDVGHCQITTDLVYLQGSRVVYCEAGGIISASIRHDSGTDVDLNSETYPGASGYISISWCANIHAANNQ